VSIVIRAFLSRGLEARTELPAIASAASVCVCGGRSVSRGENGRTSFVGCGLGSAGRPGGFGDLADSGAGAWSGGRDGGRGKGRGFVGG